MTVLGEELLASYLLVFQYIIYIMRDTSLSRVSDIELGSLLVREILWSLDLTRVFLWGGECNGDVRWIRLTVGDVSKALVFWGVIGLSNRGWKFISLTIAKADEISIWSEYNGAMEIPISFSSNIMGQVQTTSRVVFIVIFGILLTKLGWFESSTSLIENI